MPEPRRLQQRTKDIKKYPTGRTTKYINVGYINTETSRKALRFHTRQKYIKIQRKNFYRDIILN